MNKKILTLTLLAPLLYTACSTTSSKTSNNTIEKTQTTTISQEVQENVQTTVNTSSTLSSTNEATVNYANDKKNIKQKGMMHISSFMQTLKPTLKGLIQNDKSFKTAMGGCTSMGQSMTNDYNAVSPDTKVRRTALKYRNPVNAPDATDTTVMERFLASNNFKDPLVVEMPTQYRVYKALEIKQPCLACHGTNISTDLKEMLLKSYPQDMATNFRLGEFRGVVVAEIAK